MDRDGIAAGAEHLPQLGALTSTREIKDYTSNLLDFLEDLVKRIVLVIKDIVGYLYP